MLHRPKKYDKEVWMWEEEIELFHNNMCKENIELSITKEIVDKMVELFVSPRKKFVRQKPNGDYTHSNGFVNKMFLGDGLIESHLRGTDTIGIFSPEWYSKFITFDVDLPNLSELARQGFVERLIEELENVGISREYIHVSLSGSKGYHVTIFISDMTHMSNIENLYEHALESIDTTRTVLELRPSSSHALKLSLGINRKTNVRCWYVDRNFEPIKSFDYILGIEKIDRDEFQEIVGKLKEKKFQDYKRLDNVYFEYNEKLPMSTIDSTIELEMTGLEYTGTRNYTCLQLGVLYNTIGFEKHLALERLNNFMDKQNPEMYSTPLNKCYKENRLIINWVYKRDVKFSTTEKEKIRLYDKEIKLISSVKNKRARHLLFAMICHQKRYFDKSDSPFYMTFTQIRQHTGYKNYNYITKAMDELCKLGLLKIIRKGEIRDKMRYLSNVYQLEYDNVYEDSRVVWTICDYTMYMRNKDRLNKLYIL